MFLPLKDSIAVRHPPIVNWLLILANVAIYFYEVSLPRQALDAFVYDWGLVPANFHPHHGSILAAARGAPTILTSMFLHAGPFHLAGNMLFLWIFGDNIEDKLGSGRYLVFYLGCGIVAALAQMFARLDSTIAIVGASGAIGGVMGAYMITYPKARVLTAVLIVFIVRLVWIPAIFFLGLWFALQLLMAFASREAMNGADAGGVAFWAHVGGFIAGMVLVRRLGGRSDRRTRPRDVSPDRVNVIERRTN